jgi:dienelactone hydrolase
LSALPDASDLAPAARALYHGSVGFDYLLRTGLAAAIAAATTTTAPVVLSGTEARRLAFYAELADARDATRVFAPPEPVRVRATPGDGPGVEGGRVELLRFDSPFVALNPELRRDYARHENNATARAQHWRHASGPRPTLIVVHGFGASPAWFNTMFFALRDVFADGWDVLLYTLPFHGSRRNRWTPLNGIGLLSHGMAHFSEGMIHAIHDLRAFVDHLEAAGVERIGITGLSLGGYTTALAAAVEPRLDFAVPNAAVTYLPPMIDSWFPASVTTRALRAMSGASRDEFERAVAVTSPLTYAPVLARERLMIVAGLGDRLAPPEQSLRLAEHWGRPALRWFPGSHVLHFGREEYRLAMRELMA